MHPFVSGSAHPSLGYHHDYDNLYSHQKAWEYVSAFKVTDRGARELAQLLRMLLVLHGNWLRFSSSLPYVTGR